MKITKQLSTRLLPKMSSSQTDLNNRNTFNTETHNGRHVGGGGSAGEELITAAKAGYIFCLCELINNGADVNYRNQWRQTALHWAAYYGHVRCVRKLMAHAGDIHAQQDNGANVLHYAALGKRTDIVRLLIKRGCDIHAQSNYGWTVLHDAAKGGSTQCVRLLVNKGCKIHARDQNENTVLHAAAEYGNPECVQLFFDLGVDVSVKNRSGETAYDAAIRAGKTDNAELIRRLSASQSPIEILNEQPNSTPQSTSIDLDEPNQPMTQPNQPNHCMRCQCGSCTSKDNQLNNLQQENNELKQKVATMETKEEVFGEKLDTVETRLRSFEQLEERCDNLERENAESKEQLAVMLQRIKSLELRERGHGPLPRLVTSMEGFDIGNMIGKGNIGLLGFSFTRPLLTSTINIMKCKLR